MGTRGLKRSLGKLPALFSILRYQEGSSSIELQLKLKNGKTFNFSRNPSEPISALRDRMVNNITKKMKTFDSAVEFWMLEPNGESVKISDAETISGALLPSLKGKKEVVIKVGDYISPIVANPPEVYSIKVITQAIVGLPMFPRCEGSKNFDPLNSMYIWEARLKSESKKWKAVSEKMYFSPSTDLLDYELRVTCYPLGKSGSEETPVTEERASALSLTLELKETVRAPYVKPYLFEVRKRSLMQKSELDPNNIRVVSYNILAELLATEEWFVSSPKKSLPIDYRLPLITEELKCYEPDIVCLQEMDRKHFTGNYGPYLKFSSHLGGVYVDEIGNFSKDGPATFYNTEKFELIESSSILLKEYIAKCDFWKSLVKNAALISRVMDRTNSLLVLLLKDLTSEDGTKRLIIVANTHLYSQPDAARVRLIQTMACTQYLSEFRKECQLRFPDSTVSIIFCGDFNCIPEYSSYRLLSKGKITKLDPDWHEAHSEMKTDGIEYAHDLNLVDSHEGSNHLTNITTAFEGCLDYILYSGDSISKLKSYPPPSKAELASLMQVSETRHVSLPNFYTPSDHMPLICDLRLNSSS